ncbi:phosphodiester glycosidase family protein, partial [uncultured Gilliamella sp.]
MCLGQKNDGSYILLAVDGKSGIAGCTMDQIARKLRALGCMNAFNLDGGGSASLWYKGKIINNPSLGEGERKIPAIMYI